MPARSPPCRPRACAVMLAPRTATTATRPRCWRPFVFRATPPLAGLGAGLMITLLWRCNAWPTLPPFVRDATEGLRRRPGGRGRQSLSAPPGPRRRAGRPGGFRGAMVGEGRAPPASRSTCSSRRGPAKSGARCGAAPARATRPLPEQLSGRRTWSDMPLTWPRPSPPRSPRRSACNAGRCSAGGREGQQAVGGSALQAEFPSNHLLLESRASAQRFAVGRRPLHES